MIQRKDIPNVLSGLRIIMVPIFIYLFLHNYPQNTIYATAVFILAGFTDILDGYIARKFKYFTKLGLFLDPLADKLLQVSAFVCLYIVKLIPLWVVVIFVAKELTLSIGAAFLFRKKNNIEKSNVFGKLASVLVFVGVILISLFGANMSEIIIDVICLIVLAGVLLALVVYLMQGYKKNIKEKI